MPRLPRVALLLFLAITLDTALQLVWKVAAARLPASGGAFDLLRTAAGEPLFLAVVTLLLLQFVNWLDVLGHADLSFAHAVTALSLVTVTLLAALLLGESIGPLKLCGIGLVLVGVLLVGTTPHLTRAPAA